MTTVKPYLQNVKRCAADAVSGLIGVITNTEYAQHIYREIAAEILADAETKEQERMSRIRRVEYGVLFYVRPLPDGGMEEGVIGWRRMLPDGEVCD